MRRLLLMTLLIPQLLSATPADDQLARYFRDQTDAISSHCLTDLKSKEDWLSRRDEYRRQLKEMLGLWPEPPRGDLHVVIAGKLDQPQFTVEKIQFQSRPGLYVTADLYVPKNLAKPAPAILYVCGHSPAKKDGVSFGNKTVFQDHAAHFARDGYVCLVPDTLQLGEIEGVHHGLYNLKMWWWISRGYTPAGVEVWNAIRCLDYLQSRPEVDPNRIGMTGRSGGGAYTWYTAAIDDRVKVAVPVAGITDMHNQVVDGCIEGHCDCMFMTNTYRWDFPQVAALIAPRPLLIGNSDKDALFPLDGVYRLHEKVRSVYRLLDADQNLGLLITEGPHDDNQDLQVPAFHWFNRFLKDDRSPLTDVSMEKPFKPQDLTIFPPHQWPADQINTKVQELFVPIAQTPPIDLKTAREQLLQKTFAGWPSNPPPLDLQESLTKTLGVTIYNFTSQKNVRLSFRVSRPPNPPANPTVILHLLGEGESAPSSRPATDPSVIDVYFSPRGLGDDHWSAAEKALTHIRRRFWVLGQSLDGMRVWDLRRALAAVKETGLPFPTKIIAQGKMAGIALFASLFEPDLKELDLSDLPASLKDGPYLLNAMKILDIPAALKLTPSRVQKP